MCVPKMAPSDFPDCIRREGTSEAGRTGWLPKRLVADTKSVGGSYCQLQMLALGVRETVAGYRLGALKGGGASPHSNASLPPYPPKHPLQAQV